MTTPSLVEHFFRHEYARVVASLTRRLGTEHLEVIEDGVQSALLAALTAWTRRGLPDNPSAWVYQAARNQVLGELRSRARRTRILDRHDGELSPPPAPGADQSVPPNTDDDLVRMLFVCCDQSVPEQSRLVMALKTLCGFSVGEIATRLFVSEANVYKRLARARSKLRERAAALDALSNDDFVERLGSVHAVLYLVFTEGYFSSHATLAIRRELCDDAIRLTKLLVAHRCGQTPATAALLALMYLHAARLEARTDAGGLMLLLEEQDRSQWNQQQIAQGLDWLAHSAEGDTLTRYHAEASIAAEHCLAPSFAETRWDAIAESYALLARIEPSPVHRLNWAMAIAEAQSAQAALQFLEQQAPPAWLEGTFVLAAVRADLFRRCGAPAASEHADQALSLAPNEATRQALRRRLES
ncbi:MAG: sigma-70 family RNA polymerase sigma factor [Pseudomonadota bacterium]